MSYDRGQRERDAHINDARRQLNMGLAHSPTTVRGLIDACVQLERRNDHLEAQLQKVAAAVEKKHRHGEWQLRTAVLEALDA